LDDGDLPASSWHGRGLGGNKDDMGGSKARGDRSGALDGLADSHSAGVVEVALDVGDVRDSTSSNAASRWNTGHGNRVRQVEE
jgi:hypothetical protein